MLRTFAGPLGADFHIGLPPSEFHRVANVVPPPSLPIDLTQLDPNGPMFKTFTGPALDLNIEHNWTERLAARPTSARLTAAAMPARWRIQSAVASGGEVDGVRLLSPKTINRIFEVQSDAIDLVLGILLKIGVGYGLPWPERCCPSFRKAGCVSATGRARW